MSLYKLILRHKPFKGQFRIFSWLYLNKWLKEVETKISPIIGNFKININTKNYIDACIYYLGDYEPNLKIHFKRLIKENDTVLDIGANIGFHTLYFAELTGVNGKIIAFEPIPINFKTLKNNVSLNNFPQIVLVNKALGNTNSQMNIHINEQAQNPGAFNLFEDGVRNTIIECIKGDDYLQANNIEKIDFIKIDVEGYEYEVLKGLRQTISRFHPSIIFEYDRNYQLKMNADAGLIFDFLKELNYNFYCVDGYGVQRPFTYNEHIQAAEIIALQN